MALASPDAPTSGRGIPGVLLSVLYSAGAALALLMALLVASWIVAWVMVFKVWPEGSQHLRNLVNVDFARLAVWPHPFIDPGALARALANGCYTVIFEMTGVHAMALNFAEEAALSIPDTIARNAYRAHHEAIEVAMMATQLFGMRLAVLVLTAPSVLLGYGMGLVDGLTQRAIRKARGGHESSNLYHRAKYGQVMLVALWGALILLLWIPVDPRWLSAPMAIMSALLARLQWTYYKKHL